MLVGCGGGGGGGHGHHGNDVLSTCPPIDIVFVMDTSSSMVDEGSALCSVINQVESDLQAAGATVANLSLLSIVDISPSAQADFPCLTNSVGTLYGQAVPGSPPLGMETLSNGTQDDEDSALATAIVAANHPWAVDSVRIIVPITDEGPFDGDPCNDPGDDRTATEHAALIASQANVIVSPIIGDGADACVVTLLADLAEATDGEATQSVNAAQDLSGIIVGLVEAACRNQAPTN